MLYYYMYIYMYNIYNYIYISYSIHIILHCYIIFDMYYIGIYMDTAAFLTRYCILFHCS
jgi:hypothetical protein